MVVVVVVVVGVGMWPFTSLLVDPRPWDGWWVSSLVPTTTGTTSATPVTRVGIVHLSWTRRPCNLHLLRLLWWSRATTDDPIIVNIRDKQAFSKVHYSFLSNSHGIPDISCICVFMVVLLPLAKSLKFFPSYWKGLKSELFDPDGVPPLNDVRGFFLAVSSLAMASNDLPLSLRPCMANSNTVDRDIFAGKIFACKIFA